MLTYESKDCANGDIPPGFMLSIRSWENDADLWKSEVLYGLQEGDVRFYLYVLKSYGIDNGGNRKTDGGEEISVLKSALEEFPPESQDLLDDVKEMVDLGESSDFFEDLVGIDTSGEFYRVIDSATVHYIPELCLNVTERF
ncbi:hypothetical protein SCBWM1_gp33 [Synechococcus phage S-CBWM1]|uniref:Uncharacterized protein n=1 Tax=Synechococcus phage S-CBWM1 TaxID=2053653 RepID=A0A3G1L3G3_9CAUD|nr:hypothetical protein HOU61_gp164 [Synechococcus phage S-CBWM1]ATW62717.1 hypothetical protein SCBWM1_gp33 [Synechococcus phage S-CBWM1]